MASPDYVTPLRDHSVATEVGKAKTDVVPGLIKRGRLEGWLRRPVDALPQWAELNGVKLNGIKIAPMPGFEDRGSTVIAQKDLDGEDNIPLMVVPKDLIISRQNVDLFAKTDHHLRQVLDAVGEYGHTTRGSVLIYLLMQATIACPLIPDVGVRHPLTEYIHFLPDEMLPTFWTEEEQELLVGTTLRPAVRAKLNSLLREFEHLRTSTKQIDWCMKYWWDDESGQLTFQDWMRVDAMYRSRALEFPGVGDCMMPCVDMANHAAGDATAALYEADDDGNGLLVLRNGKKIQAGGEVTITYGDEKGACEMIFSYGFLDEDFPSAKIIFLELNVPEDDPLRPAKMTINSTRGSAPGVRISEDRSGQTTWESDFVWLVCVNEEDGLCFKYMQTTDGDQEIMALFKDEELKDTTMLRPLLEKEPLWDVYRLRATMLVLGRVERQFHMLQEQGEPEKEASVREVPYQLGRRLRHLEWELLERFHIDLLNERNQLLESETVKQYLNEQFEEDFS